MKNNEHNKNIDIHNNAIREFSEVLLKQEVIDKSVIKRITEQLIIEN